MSMTRKETIAKMNRLTTWIGCAVLGVIVGWPATPQPPCRRKGWAIFLRLIKMIIG